jgi:hypothetical protein
MNNRQSQRGARDRRGKAIAGGRGWLLKRCLFESRAALLSSETLYSRVSRPKALILQGSTTGVMTK